MSAVSAALGYDSRKFALTVELRCLFVGIEEGTV